MSSHYLYAKTLQNIWEKSVETYKGGNTDLNQWYSEDEIHFLASIGMRPQEMFDFAEDYTRDMQPDFPTVAMVQDIRRAYLLEVQNGVFSTDTIQMENLPPKKESVKGIEWLPRLLEKATAKLHGTMPADLMYGCRGDRNFFEKHDIHPAEFLRKVAENETELEKVVQWVESRSKA